MGRLKTKLAQKQTGGLLVTISIQQLRGVVKDSVELPFT